MHELVADGDLQPPCGASEARRIGGRVHQHKQVAKRRGGRIGNLHAGRQEHMKGRRQRDGKPLPVLGIRGFEQPTRPLRLRLEPRVIHDAEMRRVDRPPCQAGVGSTAHERERALRARGDDRQQRQCCGKQKRHRWHAEPQTLSNESRHGHEGGPTIISGKQRAVDMRAKCSRQRCTHAGDCRSGICRTQAEMSRRRPMSAIMRPAMAPSRRNEASRGAWARVLRPAT